MALLWPCEKFITDVKVDRDLFLIFFSVVHLSIAGSNSHT